MSGPLEVWTSKPWTDYSQGSFRGFIWTVDDGWYTSVNLAVGVFFGLTQPCVELAFTHLIAGAFYLRKRTQQPQSSIDELPNEDNRSLSDSSTRTRTCCSWRNAICSKETVAKWTSAILLIFGTCYIISGAFLTKFPAGEAALSGSNTCGVWGLRDNAKPSAQDADASVQGQRESRASQYARDCYGPRSTISINQCLAFKERRIPQTNIQTGQQCPFINETYCPGTGYTAVKFETEYVDATVIGVNTNPPPKFKRTAMCVPLDLKAGFAEDLGEGRRKGEWGYRLGHKSSDEYKSNYTFEQFGDPFSYDVRSYTMSTYMHVYSKDASQNYWQPIKNLDIRPELTTQSKPYSLTIMFINSCRIFYEEASEDPIFPADRRRPNTDLWTNNDSRARPLACIDWIETCPYQGKCGPPYAGDGDQRDERGQKLSKFDVFTRYAMNKSTTFHAIEYQGATGLDAQYKIKDDTSLPLSNGHPQWIIESWSLFNTSLARIQYDAFDIANGTSHDSAPLYVPKMPARFQDEMCGIFTFQIPKGYNNFRIWQYILLGIALPLVVVGLTTPTSVKFSDEKMESGYFEGMTLLFAEWLGYKIGVLFKGIWRSMRGVSSRPPDDPPPQRSQHPRQANYGTMSTAQSPVLSTHEESPVGALPSTSVPQPTLTGSPSQEQDNQVFILTEDSGAESVTAAPSASNGSAAE